MAARHNTPVPSGTEAQRRCCRDFWCTAKTRDPESGEWLPAIAAQPLCPADRTVLITCLGELPGCYERLGALSASPVRRNRPVRVAPGSRVLVDPEADALMRETADVTGGWAARVRAVPQLSFPAPPSRHGSQARVAADCGMLAAHPDPLLALPPGPMTRTRAWRPGDPMPAETEREVAGMQIAYEGDGWVSGLLDLDGEAAALELFDLRVRAVRMLGETPAPLELLDGIPCRACEAMSSLERLPSPPPDPEKPEPAFCRCSGHGCRDEMTRREYDAWVRQYEAWTRGAGVLTCRRCDLGDCVKSPSACQWDACACRAAGHRKAA